MSELSGRLRRAAATAPFTAVDRLLREAAEELEAGEAVVAEYAENIAALDAQVARLRQVIASAYYAFEPEAVLEPEVTG